MTVIVAMWCGIVGRGAGGGGGGGAVGTNYHQIAKRLVSNFALYILGTWKSKDKDRCQGPFCPNDQINRTMVFPVMQY